MKKQHILFLERIFRMSSYLSCMLMLFISCCIFANTNVLREPTTAQHKQATRGNTPQQDPFLELKRLYSTNQEKDAYDLAQKILLQYPNHYDVKLILGYLYYRSKNFEQAKLEFDSILKNIPKYTDAREGLVRVLSAQKRYQAALNEIKLGLKNNPDNKIFLEQKERITNYLKHQRQQMIKPDKKKIRQKVPSFGKKKIVKNNAGLEIGTNLSYASDLKQIWSTSFADISYKTHLGRVDARFGKVFKFNKEGMTLGVTAYPKFKYGYFYLDYERAPKEILPSNRYTGEIYLTLTKKYEASLGGRYIKTTTAKLKIYTGSFGYTFDKYSLTVRPFIAFHNNKMLRSYFIGLKRYFNDHKHYIAITAGGGRALDDVDVDDNVVDAIQSNGVWLSLYSPFINGTYIRLSVSYQNYKLPKNKIRNLYEVGFSLGV